MKAFIEVDIPDFQIGQEVSIYFKDTMMIKGVVQEPMSGYWIDTNSESFEFHRVYKCSECGNTEIEYPEVIRGHFRYCPNCGARMESEEV